MSERSAYLIRPFKYFHAFLGLSAYWLSYARLQNHDYHAMSVVFLMTAFFLFVFKLTRVNLLYNYANASNLIMIIIYDVTIPVIPLLIFALLSQLFSTTGSVALLSCLIFSITSPPVISGIIWRHFTRKQSSRLGLETAYRELPLLQLYLGFTLLVIIVLTWVFE